MFGSAASPKSTRADSAAAEAWWDSLAHPAQGRLARLAPMAVALALLAAIALSIWYLRQVEIHRVREGIAHDVEYAQQRLRLNLLEDQERGMQLAAAATRPGFGVAQFRASAESLLAASPSVSTVHWLDADGKVLSSVAAAPEARRQRQRGDALGTLAQASFERARDLTQATYALLPADAGQAPAAAALQLTMPIASGSRFLGAIVAEYAPERLLRHGVPAEVQAKYATALLDGQGQWLAGQRLAERPALSQRLPWMSQYTEILLPVPPVDGSLQLRVQSWWLPHWNEGGVLLWLVVWLSVATTWALVNWRHALKRRQTQTALESEIAFRRAMENSMITGIRVLDLQGRIIYVNPAFSQMTGWSAQDLIGRAEPYPYWLEEDCQAHSARLRERPPGGAIEGATGYQMRVKRKDGSVFSARMYMSALVDGAGTQIGWMGSMTDITEPNRIRQQLAASYERFTTVLEALDASVSVTPLGSAELLFANKLYRHWFGASPAGHQTLVVQGGAAVPPASDESATEADIPFAGFPRDGLGAALTGRAEIYVAHLGKWLEVRSRYLNWVDGRLAQMIIATDITARRHAEGLAERAQTSSRLITMGEMASSVAHELNQPLTAISNYCNGMISRIRSGAITPGSLLDALEKTAHQAQRAGLVVHHIRSFVKRSAPQRAWTEVTSIVDQVVELAEIDLRRRQVRLAHQVAAGLPRLYADPILIEQVLLNLIKNGAESIEAAQRDAGRRVVDLRVTQRLIERQPVVHFSVTDTGRGLSPEERNKVYEAFYSTKQEGMGIGLNLCRSIVESHHGRIQADNLYNATQVAGCRFTFWIPVDGADGILSNAPEAANPA
ncbi:MAG: PAS domain S-box protein [Burkholderiaceae bacterium]|jgi:PAS domain S-box-containing protein|nr:PAS domain S-box protein [Burkholderiaceae bacterium]